MIQYFLKKRFGWIRIFGKGVAYRDTTVRPLLFSERNGYVPYVKIGKWVITWLK